MKYNLHTHSVYCGHGSGTIKEYSDFAQESGYEMFGFSEHIPFPDNHFKSSRMEYSIKSLYEEDVKREKDREMKVLLGYECDYSPEWKGYFEDTLGVVDYLIAGTHYMKRECGTTVSPFSSPFSSKDFVIYANATIKAMESRLFSFIAHPDVYLCMHPFDKNAKAAAMDIIEAAVELSIPLEINSNGIAKSEGGNAPGAGYPCKEFWLLAKERGVKAVLSSDAHNVANVDKFYKRVVEFAENIGIELLEPEFVGGKLSFKTQVDK